MDFTQIVNRIEVPKGFSLLGVQPIISMFLKTDDLDRIFQLLKSLSTAESKDLVESITTTLENPNYPFENSVFFANDPLFEIDQLSNALQNKTTELGTYLESLYIFKPTYPFIETLFEPLNSEDVLPMTEAPLGSTSTEEVRENPPKLVDQAHNASGFLIPTLTLGSMYLFTKYAYNGTKG